MEELEYVKISFELTDEFQNNTKLDKIIGIDSMENGQSDIYFLLEEFQKFLLACGYSPNIVNKIQYIEETD